MENNQRKIRQREGIKLAQMRKIYQGREKGAKTSPASLLNKYRSIADLLDKNELSMRRIAGITGHSINTVRRIKQLKEL
jgi:DNA invertase Pin-like site-specific DNA recombinase